MGSNVLSNVICIHFLLTVDDSWDASVLVNSSTPCRLAPCQDFSMTPTVVWVQKLADRFPWPPVCAWVIQALTVKTKTLHAITLPTTTIPFTTLILICILIRKHMTLYKGMLLITIADSRALTGCLTPVLKTHTCFHTLTHTAVSLGLKTWRAQVEWLAGRVLSAGVDLVGRIRGRDDRGWAREAQVPAIVVEALHLSLTGLWDCLTFIYICQTHIWSRIHKCL